MADQAVAEIFSSPRSLAPASPGAARAGSSAATARDPARGATYWGSPAAASRIGLRFGRYQTGPQHRSVTRPVDLGDHREQQARYDQHDGCLAQSSGLDQLVPDDEISPNDEHGPGYRARGQPVVPRRANDQNRPQRPEDNSGEHEPFLVVPGLEFLGRWRRLFHARGTRGSSFEPAVDGIPAGPGAGRSE